MRTPNRYIAALLFLFTTFLATCLLWQPGWSHISPGEIVIITADKIAKPFRRLHTPFVLIRLYRKSIGTYQAPLIRWSDEVETPDSYAVALHPGYSMDAHKTFVGVERLQPCITSEEEMPEFYHVPGYYYYYADLDEGMLEAVRADVGVDRVSVRSSVVYGGHPIEQEDHDEVQRKFVVAMLLEELLGPEWEDELPSMLGLFADLRGIEAP